ncbi:LOW QUALITY PROTEIN: reticulon-4-interacting protein 1 homolog, mitochondrial-like [Haliotis rubra]|uniref:LOW QUALITY PROTEIN: reticulon-4-interacting protein 1 homolog, mitochondrial-like n=1 Tax=Haliotis rubra TaxID=36100 RepID=UPI001EE592E5|nr:LOW QUALITY PROTEIN: reticulon-4-interacting protein 1 homolog, mitochondrial-like [Haliotis rubra]
MTKLRSQISNQHIQNVHKSTRSSMSAWQIHQYGGNEEFTLSRTAKVPTIHSPEELLIEVHAASVNPIDVHMRGGYGEVMLNSMRKLLGKPKSGNEFPLTLGRDFSGVVLETGKRVTDFKPGDQVWGAVGAHRQGTHAELLVTSQKEISKKPKTLDHLEAASIPYVAVTSWTATEVQGKAKRKEGTQGKQHCREEDPVHAGSGGIGTFSIQLLSAWGADVTTTCSTDAVEFVTSLGANTVIDYKTQDVEAELQKLDKFDLVLDTLGGETPNFSFDLLTKYRNAKYVSIVTPLLRNADSYGLVKGSVKTAVDLLKDVAGGIKHLRSYRWAVFVPNGRALKKVAKMVDNSDIKPVVEKVFQFEEVPNAFDKLAAGHSRGKTVIKVI